jgi:hypothetical protein
MLDVLDGLPVVVAPVGLLDLAATAVRGRGAVTLAREKGHTMSAIAARLAEGDHGGRVTHRDSVGGEWSITMFLAASAAVLTEATGQ